jgi:hypothetical protein
MAGDWIKMRVSLARDPAVVAMADFLAEQREFMDWLSDPVRRHCSETAYEHVTRNVTVSVTVCALLSFWGVANEVGKPDGDDLILRHATLDSVDESCGVPCFGLALQFVDWAIQEDADGKHSVRLPKFLINNVPAEDRSKKTNADRQKRFREKQALLGNEESNVTRNVTVTHREEKRREEKKEVQQEVLPAWLPADRWQDFVDHRKAIKKPMTDRAKGQMVKHLCNLKEQGHDVLALIDKAIRSGWQDVYPPKAADQFNSPAVPAYVPGGGRRELGSKR